MQYRYVLHVMLSVKRTIEGHRQVCRLLKNTVISPELLVINNYRCDT